MTETPPPPPDPAPPPRRQLFLGRLAAAVRRQDWAAVAVEVAVVVIGVVIGFQVTAWGQARADRAEEQTYLRQLAADLRETERQLAQADSSARGPDRATRKLVLAYYLPERPPRDSVLAWFRTADRHSPIRPVTGTAEALVATGDLGLIQNDSLRSHITAYLDDTRKMMDYHDERVSKWLEHIDRLYGAIDVWAARVEPLDAGERGALRAEGYDLPEEASRRDPFPFEVEEFLTDRDMHFALYISDYTKLDMTLARRRVRERSAALREQVEAEIDR